VSATSSDGTTIEYQLTGSGEPVTCFVPGLGQSVADTRPFGSGVHGSRAFLDLRGHGRSAAPPPDDARAWTYSALAADVEAVVVETGSTRAVGVSLGAGALLNLAIRRPQRFDRMVLALPSVINETRDPAMAALAAEIADAVDANDQVVLSRLLLQLQPPSVRGRADVGLWARRHAADVGGTPVSRVLRALPRQVPVSDPAQLETLDLPVLVLAQRDDPSHPVEVAEQLGDLLPDARVVVSDVAWIWAARTELRDVVTGFLNP